MPKKHISVWKAVLIWFVGIAMILVGGFNAAMGNAEGAGLLILGFIVIIVNKFVFRIHTSQLKIDTMEGIRDQIGNVCPQCGQRLTLKSKYCDNCGFQL